MGAGPSRPGNCRVGSGRSCRDRRGRRNHQERRHVARHHDDARPLCRNPANAVAECRQAGLLRPLLPLHGRWRGHAPGGFSAGRSFHHGRHENLAVDTDSKDKNAGVTYDPTNPAQHGDVNTDDLMKTADAFSKMAKTTAIYLARMGVDGTSGNHYFRKTLHELHLMSAALDAIKQSYGFEGFHLAGQSGGSTLLTGLATMRRDIACAVSGSGPLGKSYDISSKDPARTLVNPLGFVPSIAQNRSVRFFMGTDSADRSVPAKQQSPFAEKMHRAGRDIPQDFVTATDDYHHGVVGYTGLVTGGCVLGKSDAEIATAVGTMIKRNAAYNGQRSKEIALFGEDGTALPHPSADSRTDTCRPTRTRGKRTWH